MNMEMKIDYGTFRPAPPTPVDNTLYASIDGRVSPLANDEVVFYDPQSETNHVMTQQVLQALDLTREFRPLAQHVARVADQIEGLRGKDEAVRRVLESLAKRGLLRSDADFLRGFAQDGASTAVAPVLGLFIRACDRPERVRRLLDSLLQYEQRHRAAQRYVLVDDSRRTESVRSHADLLRHFGEASGCRTVHVTSERSGEIVGALQRALPSHASALAALLQRDPGDDTPRGGGIGRNLITLLAAGGRYALLDDDFLFPLRRHPEYAPGLCGDARGFAVRTFASRDAALAAGTDTDFDPVAAHFDACGRLLPEAMATVEGCRLTRADLIGLAPGRTPALRADARVVLTLNGHRGASGSASLAWAYMLAPAERAGFAADRDVYLATHRDPSVWFGAARFMSGSGSQFTPFAVDNSMPMPCTSARGRGEDALYNALVPLFRRDAQTLDFPFAIGHAPEARGERTPAADLPDLNNCLAEFARHVSSDTQGATLAARIEAFGARLADLAAAPDRDLNAYLREYLAYRRSGTIQRLQLAATLEPQPPLHWIADLRTLVESNGKALIERGVPRFAGSPAELDTAAAAQHFRREAAELVDGLRAWPAAWEFALTQRWLD
jgi:hypothetical protein